MPKILMIQPTQYSVNGTLCKQKRIHLPGLVFPLLKAMTPEHWDVEVLIEVVDEIDFENDADLIAIGTMGHTIFRAREIAREFKKRGKTVVMGGYMASMVPDLCLDEVDSVIGFGGGSAIDAAKAVACLVSNNGILLEYLDNEKKFKDRTVTLIAVPTTSGTGSEVTNVGVYTDKVNNKKKPLVSDKYWLHHFLEELL